VLTVWWPFSRLVVNHGPSDQALFFDDRHDTAGFPTADQPLYSDKAEDRDQLQILFLEDGIASEPPLRTAGCVWP
jgi:hypothetical protein